MNKFVELYQKVASDSALREEFARIMSEAEKAGNDKTEAELAAFTKKAGSDVSLEEVRQYMEDLQAGPGELTDAELDAVAGGKSEKGLLLLMMVSIAGLGIACVIATIVEEATAQGCEERFK